MGPKQKMGPQMGPKMGPWVWDMPNLDMGRAQPGHGTCPTWHGTGPTWTWDMPNLDMGHAHCPWSMDMPNHRVLDLLQPLYKNLQSYLFSPHRFESFC